MRLHFIIWHDFLFTTTFREFVSVEPFFREQSEAILPYLYLLKRGLTSLHSAEESSLFFNAPDLSGTSAIIQDKVLSLSQIGELHRRASDEIQSELDELTFNHPNFILPTDLFIHDDPRELAPGYSFLKDPRNMWNDQPSLIEHILNTPSLFSEYAYLDPQGHISWYPSKIAALVKRIYDLQRKILCNVILSYGEPARGTELASHLLANVSGGSIRNFFVLFNIPILRGSFNKTTSLHGHDKAISRIPVPIIGRHLVRFLVFLRPVFYEWQGFLRPWMANDARDFLFPGLHERMKSTEISKALFSYTKKELGVPLTIRKFRQYMAFMTNSNMAVFEAAEVRNTAAFEQFGHTAEVNAQHYGHDARTPDGMNISIFTATARVSGVFHILFGHPPDLLERLEYGKGPINELVSVVNKIRHRQQPLLSSVEDSSGQLERPSSGLVLQDIATTLKLSILPEIIGALKHVVAESNASLVDLFAPKLTAHAEPAMPLPRAPDIVVHPFLLKKLRDLYPEMPASIGFINVQQAQVTQLLWERERHVAYISPTGAFHLNLFLYSVADASQEAAKRHLECCVPSSLTIAVPPSGCYPLFPSTTNTFMHPRNLAFQLCHGIARCRQRFHRKISSSQLIKPRTIPSRYSPRNSSKTICWLELSSMKPILSLCIYHSDQSWSSCNG